MHENVKGEGVVFIGLTPESESANDDSRKFLTATGVTWPNAYGAGKTLEQFKAEYFPSVWVIGRDGKVVWNRDSGQSIEEAIAAALKAKG
ncbi:MAG: hypothetical protein HZA46_08100 [Planctomycetales bacterium]|nr:hypothetical protein [Planctomycetales bacterium]